MKYARIQQTSVNLFVICIITFGIEIHPLRRGIQTQYRDPNENGRKGNRMIKKNNRKFRFEIQAGRFFPLLM